MKHWRLGFKSNAPHSVRVSRQDSQAYWIRRGHHRPLIEVKRRRSIMASVADAVREWRYNPWEREGEIVAELRGKFIADGFGFHDADAEAYDIVRLAFVQIGRGVETRPSWDEGQIWFTTSPENCNWCGIETGDDRTGRGNRYCSKHCATSALYGREYEGDAHKHALGRRAYAEMLAFDFEPRPCAHCGTDFRPMDDPDARYCSRTCQNRDREGYRPDRECKVCGEAFRPKNEDHWLCSWECAGVDKRQHEERPCPICDTPFRTRNVGQETCSPSCGVEWKRLNAKPQTCEQCGGEFKSPKPSRFCGDRCRNKHAWQIKKAKEKPVPKATLMTGPFGDPERVIDLPEPTTIAEIIATNGLQFRLPTIAVIDGEPVLRKEWPTRAVASNVAFVSLPGQGGSNGAGKQILGLVAGLALAVAAPMVGAALFGAGTLGASLVTGLVLAPSSPIITLEFHR